MNLKRNYPYGLIKEAVFVARTLLAMEGNQERSRNLRAEHRHATNLWNDFNLPAALRGQARRHRLAIEEYWQKSEGKSPPKMPPAFAEHYEKAQADRRARQKAREVAGNRQEIAAAAGRVPELAGDHKDIAEILGEDHAENFHEAHAGAAEARRHIRIMEGFSSEHKGLPAMRKTLADHEAARQRAHDALRSGFRQDGIHPVHIHHALTHGRDVNKHGRSHMDAVAHFFGGTPSKGGYSFENDEDRQHFHSWAALHHGERLPVVRKRRIVFRNGQPTPGVQISDQELKGIYNPNPKRRRITMEDTARGLAEELQKKVDEGTRIHTVDNVRHLGGSLYEIKTPNHPLHGGMRTFTCSHGHYLDHCKKGGGRKGTSEQDRAIERSKPKLAQHLKDHPAHQTTESVVSLTMSALMEWFALEF